MRTTSRQIAVRVFILIFMLTTVAVSASQTWAIDSAVKEVRGPIWVSVPTTGVGTRLQSITVRPASSGYVTVTATGTMTYDHTLNTEGNYCLDLHTVSAYVGGCTPMSGSDSAIRSYIPSGFPTTRAGFGPGDAYSIKRTWPVTANTSYTFYLNGYAKGLSQAYLFHPTITVIYTPRLLP